MTTTIFLPVENTLRELEYKLNLARRFCKAGFEVILGNPPFIRDELKYKNYKAVFLEKGANPDSEYYQHLKNKGVLIYDLGDEGAATPVYSITYQPCIESLKTMEKVFLWGSYQKKDLITRNEDLELAQKYHVVGHPALDLCLSKFREMYHALKPVGLPKSYILVNTNFGTYNGYSIEEHLKACPQISPESHEGILESYEREKKQFIIFKEWLEEVIKSFPQEIFVIRPHPTELQEKYEALFSKYSNVQISKEGSANQVIACAKLVLHKDCTTALQTYLMGIPVISLGGIPINGNYEKWALAFSLSPNTIEEAKRIISKVLITKTWDKKIKLKIHENANKILNSWFCNLGRSTDMVADYIINDAREKLGASKPGKIIDSRSLLRKIKQFIRAFLPLHYKVAPAARETMKEITLLQINTILNLLETYDPLKVALKVKKIYPNTYKISRDQ